MVEMSSAFNKIAGHPLKYKALDMRADEALADSKLGSCQQETGL
jgi:hypothetical protein